MALVHRLRSGGFVRRWRVWSRSNAQWEVSHGQPDRISEEGVTTGRQGTILAGFRGWTRGLCSRKGLSPPAAESTNAYEVLGVTRHSSQEEIQAAFRALAKATHPDLQPRDAQLSSTASFVRILAAYQILSDSEKRAHYDAHLRLRKVASNRKQGSMGGVVAPVAEPSEAAGDSDCVEWLRHYRWVVTQLVHHPQLGQGDGFEERVRGEVHSALRKAYFGPTVRSPTLPSCFEAEERAQPGGVMDVLHLVSGRQLLGVVRQVGGFFLPEEEKAAGFLPFDRGGAAGFSATSGPGASFRGTRESSCGRQTVKGGNSVEDVSGASVDLELHLFGKVVAKASRKAGKGPRLDEIFVHLSGEPEDDEEQPVNSDTNSDILLGSIRGIGSSANSCAVHDAQGKKTHFILQHWTPMVKHMMWYRLGQGPARCECRSRRARLPSSRYWLFEPRCSTHNIGGWYIETFGRRNEDDEDEDGYRRPAEEANPEAWVGQHLGLLHPAMYIMAAAYKTLDEEAVKIERETLISSLQNRGTWILEWWTRKWRLFCLLFKR